LYVANGDWYVSVFEPQNATAAYYKNGVRINLSSGSLNASAQNIYVFGEDVYVVGYIINSAGIYNAVYWKNGVMTTISSNNSTGGSIYVDNGNVYVGGTENINGNTIATIWENGVATNVGPPNLDSYCFQVITLNSDVYAVGYETDSAGNSEALLWKNGVTTTLGPTPSYAYAIYPKLE